MIPTLDGLSLAATLISWSKVSYKSQGNNNSSSKRLQLITLTTREEDYPSIERNPSAYHPKRTYHLTGAEQKHYEQQYGDMYFCRLAQLKPAVEQAGMEAWADFEVNVLDHEFVLTIGLIELR